MKDVILKKGKILEFSLLEGLSEETHFHQDIELIYVLDGSFEVKIIEEVFQMNKDDVVVINPNKKHSYKASKDALIGIFMIEFQELSSHLERDLVLFWCNSIIDESDSYDMLRSYIKKILNHYLITKGKADYYQLSLYYGMVDCLINYYLIDYLDERFKDTDKEDIRINEITNYVNSNYNTGISLNDLANKLFLSNAYLSRYIKKNFGITFMEYVNTIRLHHAVEDLIYGNKSITKVAFDNGFANSAIFNKIFKETYGIAPSTYQKNIREELEKRGQTNLIHDANKLMNRLSDYLENAPEIQENERRNALFIKADSEKRRVYKKNWNKMINIGSASDLLKSAMQEHVLQLKKKLRFQYIRFWGIFHSDMYVGLRSQKGIYNFDNVDRVLDFLVKNEIKPYIELSQKPRIIHRRIGKPVVEEEMRSLFSNLEECEIMVEYFISHQVERYGIEEVETWYFDMWNNNQAKIDNEYIEEFYFKTFNSLSRIIKKYVPKAKVGGAGLAIDYGKKKFSELIDIWASHEIKPDFLSLSMYPYVLGKEMGKIYGKSSTDKNYLINKIKEAKEILKSANMDDIELHISEWNSTISNRNYSNDSCYKGAYIMKNIIDCSEEVDLIGYWIGSDLFSEFYDTNNLLWGGAGLISKDGIEKPAFYGFEFMNRMGMQFIQKGENYMITANSHNGYYIACHNYKHFNYYYYLKSEDDIPVKDQYNIFEDKDKLGVHFKIENVKNGRYNIKIYSMNRKNGSILDEWEHMNLTTSLSLNDVEYLKRICTPRISEKTFEVTDGTLNVETVLLPHEINVIHVSYRENLMF
ncbi:helix-turn-helix domain-containing protein [Clostridium intestinale]|uniref:GH39 family glycosyl hydrolase n=1 Tax=Clostridium intestinale TaxID=36845 RepID=UPI0028E6B9ED|nr:helix-turn-helix domain-containing protein [Clostridium intestinale]